MDRLSRVILESCIEVHREMGPGLLESIYEQCLAHELTIRRISFQQQVPLQLNYKGYQISRDLRIDLLIENQVIVELKSVEMLLPVHTAQIISYLKLADKCLGFLVNFNVPVLKEGFHRYVNNF
ncbi:MAG TPA: GxxExxY protein [bacterium]|nr:GxxExxY protein [bacterium]HPG47427.1 GxxExxY protein [bacterium]